MAKRFYDTDKYKSLFIRALPPAYKLFWDYLLCECDHAGIWKADIALAEYVLGVKLNAETALGKFNADENRIFVFDSNRKWFIVPFIKFQYGVLNPDVKVHQSVIRILVAHGLADTSGNLLVTVTEQLANSCQTVMDKNKDKNKDELNTTRDNTSIGDIEFRQEKFYDSLVPFLGKYDKAIVRAFYDYWSEPNRSKQKMRCELQPTWDTARRLAKWDAKDKERQFDNGRKIEKGIRGIRIDDFSDPSDDETTI